MPHEWRGQDSLNETRTERSNYENKRRPMSSYRACVQHSAVFVEWRVCVASTSHLILTEAPTNALGSFSEFFSIPQLIKEKHLTFTTQHICFHFIFGKISNLREIYKTQRQKNKIRLAGHLSGQGGVREITPSPCPSSSPSYYVCTFVVHASNKRRRGISSSSLLHGSRIGMAIEEGV